MCCTNKAGTLTPDSRRWETPDSHLPQNTDAKGCQVAGKVRLDDAIEQYKRYRVSKKKSLATLNSDRVTLTRLLEVVGGNQFCDKVTETHLDDLFINIGQTNSARSLCNHHYIMVSFFRWLRRRNFVPADLMEDRDPPDFTVEEKRRLPVELFPHVLEQANNPRDRALYASGFYLLCRSVELVGGKDRDGIRIGDVNLGQGRIRVHVAKQKGRNKQVIDLMPITSEYDEELRRYLMWYQDQCGYLDPSWHLFPRLSRATARRGVEGFIKGSGRLRPELKMLKPYEPLNPILEAVGFKLDGDTGEGMHTLRRGGARARFDVLVDMGYDGALRQVQSLLHHATANMTEHYIGINLDRFKRDVALIGQPMYPQLKGVVNLAEHRVDPYIEGQFETDLTGFKIRRAA